MLLDIDLHHAIAEARKRKAGIIALQLPEGLKTRAVEIAEQFRQGTGAEVVVITDPCWGACDVGDRKAKTVGADLLVHLGHSKMLPSKMPVIYVPVYARWENTAFEQGVAALTAVLKENLVASVGLTASVQYVPFLEKCRALLEKQGIQAVIGKTTERVTHDGQILGCNYSAAASVQGKVQGMVYLGEGLFHPIGIAFTGNNPVWVLTPDGNVHSISGEREQVLRKRYAAIAAARDAQKFGILMSSKRGQLRQKRALELKKMIEKNGKKAVILLSDEIRPEQVLGVGVDCYVVTACPRIAIEEYLRFDKPVLNPKELEIVLGKRGGNEFELEEWEH